MIHGLVLAGGEGSRLRATGVSTPKALVEVAGEPQIVRMVAACRRVGADTVTCAVREDLVGAVRAALGEDCARIVGVRTPTSLHTLVAGLDQIDDGTVLCTMVDSVMLAHEWDRAHGAALDRLHAADAVVAVTSYVEDEAPLWVDADELGMVRAFGQRGTAPLVTGGVYWLAPAARSEAARALTGGVQRMRGYLSELVKTQRVATVAVPRIVDLDTSADLDVALALVKGERA